MSCAKEVRLNRPPDDPIRLLDNDSEEPEALRDLVGTLDRDGFGDDRCTRLEAALLAGVPSLARREPLKRSYRTVILLAAALLLVGGVALAIAFKRSSTPAAGLNVMPPAESTMRTPNVEPGAEAESVVPSAELPGTAPLPLAPSGSAPPAASPSVSEPDPLEEERLLRRGREVLASNPAQALAITQEHVQRFRKGMLAQEREILAIDALVRLGRQQEAASKAMAFVRANPRSAYHERLRALIPDAGVPVRQ